MKAAKRLVISCVGDSITEGIGACPMESRSYPAVLQALLGERYEVKNFGASGMTLLREGDYPYVTEPRYASSLQSVPDVVILMMGTNDSKPQNWRFKELYSAQLLALIRQYQQLPTAPRVYIATCATVYDGGVMLTYSLNATSPYEGWRVSINGSKGRLEAYLPQTGPDEADSLQTIRLFDLNNNVTEYHLTKAKGDHEGGDERLRDRLFLDPRPDPLGYCAGTREGAYSLIIGAAANISIREGRTVNIKEILTEI